ncbi:DUF934 domain-containing protein [Rhodoferax saidenbachensis]|uniref:Uncharacterized protein (DUF934 family) n=1 Tax=Rhodoferax saidenbachensis TaxID=1484693 RepID=A0ABU1ZHV5_9BURK|nr:DUF934 domain-containing protein [Rhodoferax saidenbachensis]MDR7305121.1 uncharacterized protein (DUF934 family) [Rhodoferax saidenbachensis]
MKLIAASAHSTGATAENGQSVLAIANTEDPRSLSLDGVTRIDLHFPKFTDGRAYSQAFLLRRRLGFTGEIRATGDVLIDQLVQMERTGFDVAVLREDQNVDFAQRQFDRYRGFYQGDAVTVKPVFAREGATA